MKCKTDVPVEHPSTARLFQEASKRLLKLQKAHTVAVKQMSAGALAMNFTDDELALLGDYLSPRDRALLKMVGRG